MLSLIPQQYQLVAKVAIVGLIFIFGMFGGYKLASSYYSPRIDALEIQVKAYDEAYKSLAELTEKQNASILDIKKKQEDKSAEVKKSQDKAKSKVDKLYKESETLANLKLDTADKCKAASELIDRELAKEFQ